MSSPGHPKSTSFFQKAASCAVGSAIIWRTNLVGQLSARKRLAASRSISCSSENPKSNLRASVLSMGILRLETAQIHVSGSTKGFKRASGGNPVTARVTSLIRAREPREWVPVHRKMEHKDLVREEFTRQANDYAIAPAIRDAEHLRKLVEIVAAPRDARVVEV